MGASRKPADRTKIMAALVDGISDGVPLRQICREQDVGKSTVYAWIEEDGEFAGRIAHAREKGFDAIAERARATARGKKEKEGGDSSGDVQRDKLIVDTDLKLLAKWDPRRYGDAVQLKHANADGENLDIGPVSVAIRAAALIQQALQRDDSAG